MVSTLPGFLCCKFFVSPLVPCSSCCRRMYPIRAIVYTYFQVMATLQSALADPHGTSAQRRTAYRVMMGYILGLSDGSLAENLSTIVVRGRGETKAGRQAEERERRRYCTFLLACVWCDFFFVTKPEVRGEGGKRREEIANPTAIYVIACVCVYFFPPFLLRDGAQRKEERGLCKARTNKVQREGTTRLGCARFGVLFWGRGESHVVRLGTASLAEYNTRSAGSTPTRLRPFRFNQYR